MVSAAEQQIISRMICCFTVCDILSSGGVILTVLKELGGLLKPKIANPTDLIWDWQKPFLQIFFRVFRA